MATAQLHGGTLTTEDNKTQVVNLEKGVSSCPVIVSHSHSDLEEEKRQEGSEEEKRQEGSDRSCSDAISGSKDQDTTTQGNSLNTLRKEVSKPQGKNQRHILPHL